MRTLALLVLCAACRDAAEPAARSFTVEQVLDRTDAALARAADAVRGGSLGKEQYRGAWMRQHAARQALEQEKAPLAVKLSLQARKHAAKAVALNGGVPDDATFAADPAEKELKVGADDAEHNAWMERVEKTTPPAGELLAPNREGDLAGRAREVIKRTDTVVELARATAADAGAKERDKFRNLWIRQEAAKRALAVGKVRFAVKFSLIARRHAGQVLDANGSTIPPGLEQTPDEKSIKMPVEDAPDSEIDPLLAAVEKSCPPLEKLLRGEQ